MDEQHGDCLRDVAEIVDVRPVPVFPEFDRPFIVKTDSSIVTVGAVLNQKNNDGQIHTVMYASRKITSVEKGYCFCGREALAVGFALRQFRIYLLSSHPCTLMIGQKALTSAYSQRMCTVGWSDGSTSSQNTI